ncbi:MAG: hypothetical protein ABH815_04990 [Candidatus Omnitrophota bacterium]
MKMLIKYLLTIWFLTVQGLTYAEEISPTFMPESEHKEIIYVDKATGELRSRWNISLKKTFKDKRAVYEISSTGKGDYDKYRDAIWDVKAEIEERGNLLYPLYSIVALKKTDGLEIKYEKRFEYGKQKIFYTISDSEGNIIEETTFPIKGLTADSVTMTYILKTFIACRDDKAYKDFYLLSDRGKLYRVTLKLIDREMLDLPLGSVEAIKLRLIPNLGPLTGIIGSLIPPTFVWYIDQPPYEWLQYQGLETGIGSTHIRAYLFKR